jgi:N-acetyl-gamma-glutamyl-phosphate reductase
MELVRLLAQHPGLRLTKATSRQEAGRPLGQLYPFLSGQTEADLTIESPDAKRLAASSQVVFLAVPHGAAMGLSAKLIEAGCKVIDLSADFRLRDPLVYEEWYGQVHDQRQYLQEAVYGLPELYGPNLGPATRLVANPGCYPSGIILGLYPALAQGLVNSRGIIADAKSGVTGAGRKARTGTLFGEVSDSFRAYALGSHRHTPEIEQELSIAAGQPVTISFNPHLVPMNRGILATIYTRLEATITAQGVYNLYSDYYQSAPWVRVLPPGTLPETRWVRGTMYCDLGLVIDQRTGRLIIVTAVDNLCRGASGQALANANYLFGLEPTAGLLLPPLLP